MLASVERDAEIAKLTPAGVARFWVRVAKLSPEECWLWLGPLYNGYGRFYAVRRLIGAHRASFLLAGGSLAPDLFVDHICRNRACVNPAHLRAATTKQNSLENSTSVTATNARKTHCLNGHELNPENVKPTNGGRACRTCVRKQKQDRKKRIRAAQRAGLPRRLKL